MELPPQVKAAAFLLIASGIGGFFVATKVTEYLFDKSKGKGGGGDENERETKEGKKKGGAGGAPNEDKDGEDEGDADEENPQEEEGGDSALPTGSSLQGRAALRFLIGKSIRKNPGPHSPLYSYHVGRGLVGEGTAARFAVRTWSLRNGMLCHTDPQGPLDCKTIKVIMGVPAKGGPDIELTKADIVKLLALAEAKKRKDAALAEAREKEAAIKAGRAFDPKEKRPGDEEDTSVAVLDMLPERPPVNGEQVATLVIEDKGYPVIKGNMIGFPAFIPSVDDPRVARAGDESAPKVGAAISGEAVKPEGGAAEPPKTQIARVQSPKPEPVKPEPPTAAARERSVGFKDPAAKPVGFAAPKVAEKGSFQSPTDKKNPPAVAAQEPPATGQAALDRILGKTMVPYGTKAGKFQPYLGFFESDGKFLQLTRNNLAPFEVIVTMSSWSFKDNRLCVMKVTASAITVAAPTAAAATSTDKPGRKGAKNTENSPGKFGTACLVPQITRLDETNIINFKNQKLMVGAYIVLPTKADMRPEPYGPFQPGAFRPVATQTSKPAATPAATSANGFGKARI